VIRIVLADDEPLIRGGLRALLEAEDDMRVVAECDDGAAAVDAVRLHRPDVAVLDVRMPGVDGIEATRRLAGSGARILMLTTFDGDEHVFAALQAGAAGFLTKDTTPDRLVEGVRIVARGDQLLAPAITRRLIAEKIQRFQPEGDAGRRVDELTEREKEVLLLVARGLSNRDIGDDLHLSEATVKTHITRVLAKLGLQSRTQAVVFAYEHGLVTPGEPAA
jgi:DNA-binding NarL/FixJ family response regulator